jgi:palmitoyltransferase
MEEAEEIILFVESKFCTICHIEQPLRCKHCKHCDHCVATFDHHCPWLGNCVGERNRFTFYIYLFSQALQQTLAIVLQVKIILADEVFEVNKSMWWYLLFLSTMTSIGFFFMVSSLFAFHTYLISRNLTTWEFLSWKKISYMKVWPKKYGSPFHRGSK